MTKLTTIHHSVANPFSDYPRLRSIWPEPYAQQAEHASAVDCQTGQILYIEQYGAVVGITGIFFEPECPTDIFLRWTGVVPECRCRGIATEALRLLAYMCASWCPDRKRLIELVPDNEYGHQVPLPFFTNLGFVPCSVVAHEATDWPVLPYALDIEQVRSW